MMTRWNCYECESVIVICGMTWKYDWYKIVVTMEGDKWACMMNGAIWHDYWDNMKLLWLWNIWLDIYVWWMYESDLWSKMLNDTCLWMTLRQLPSSSAKRTILTGCGPTQVGHRNQEWFGVVRPKVRYSPIDAF